AILSVLSLFLLIERPLIRWTIEVQGKIHLGFSSWLTQALRTLVLSLGPILTLPFLILLSFFPIRAIFGPQRWTLFLTDGLVLFLLYRIVKAVISVLFRLNTKNAKDYFHYSRVEHFFSFALRTILLFLLALAAIERFEYHEELYAFTAFSF